MAGDQRSQKDTLEHPLPEASADSKADENSTNNGHVEYGDGNETHISPHHANYLLNRYGTAKLEPLPDPTDADPLNWAAWKKVVNLVLVAFHACVGTFTASSVIPAFESISLDLEVSIQKASYMTSLQIAILGGAPLIWLPLSKRFGRRPIFLASLICSLVCNIGCAESKTYASMAASRALVAFFISPAAAIGSGVVQEVFFRHERARFMGIWTLMVTMGVPLSPFIFGFVVQNVGYRWIYWILAITNAVQFVVYLAFGSETRYMRGKTEAVETTKERRLGLTRIDPTPFSALEFVHPLIYFSRLRVLIPAAAYAMIFLFSNVLTTVEIPQLFIPKFKFDPQTIGLQFLALIVGSVVGELLGGSLSDYWMAAGEKRNNGHRPNNEYRLWLYYIGSFLSICGVAVFLAMTEKLKTYNVSPIIGAGIAAAGNQIVTTVLITYAVDCYPQDAASVGVFITFVRQIWGFIGPFWFPPMFESLGGYGSAGLCVGLIVVVSVIPMAALHFVRNRRN